MKMSPLFIASLLVVVLVGCAGKPPPKTAVPPAWEVEVAHAVGSPLGQVVSPMPASPLLVEARCVATRSLPADFGPRAVVAARLITGGEGEPVATSTPLAERLLFRTDPVGLPDQAGGETPGFGPVSPPIDTRLIVVPGGTSRLRYRPTEATADEGWIEFAFVSADVLATPTPQLLLRTAEVRDDAAGTTGPVRVRTTLLPWPGTADEAHFAVAMPATTGRGPGTPILWTFKVGPLGDDPAQRDELDRIVASLVPDGTRVAARAPWADALRHAAKGPDVRRALLFVAGQLGAEILAEAALLLPDAEMPALTDDALAILDAVNADTSGEQLAWQLDRAAIVKFANAIENSPSLSATFTARFGEVGRDPAAVTQLSNASSSRKDFDARLQAEHILLLEDTSPAARVRAFDWMKSRGMAPADYDPLGSRSARRAAIEKHLQPPTTQDAP